MRVYGALMWSLGKVLNTPEVTRVYIGYVTLYMYVSVKMFSFFDMESWKRDQCVSAITSYFKFIFI
jgi:hypothetical protein